MDGGEVEASSCSLWKTRLAQFAHPREGEEVDYIFAWRFDHERSVMSPEIKRRIRSKHSFRDPPILYQRSRRS